MQHDNHITRNVADAALKILMGEEPDNAQFTKEVEKAKTKATEKKSAKDEARVASPKVDASVTVPESGVTVKEELKGSQHKIDANKNGKIDAEDFKMLRKKKSAKRTVTIDKPDRLVSMKVSKEEVEEVDEGAVGATLGAIGGAALTGGPVGAGLGAIAGHKVGEGLKKIGRKIKAGAQAAKKQESVEVEGLEELEEGRLKDMVTGHMDDGHSFETAMKKAQADLNKMAVKKASDEHPEAKFRTNPLKPVMSKSDREASKKNLGKLLNKKMKKEQTELEEADSKALAAAFKKLKGKSTMSNKSSTGGTITRPAPGVTRHKAKLASGAEYGDSSKDTEASDKEPAKFKRAYKRKSYGARQNYDRGTRVSGKDVNESFGFSAMLESYKEKGLDYIREMNEDVELLDEKNKPTNPALWSKAKAAARAKFDVYPSAYANGWAAKWYKKRGGGWKSVSEEVELTEAYKLTKTYNDKDSAEHDVHHKGKHVGYIVHDKKSGQHIAYHSPENGEFNQSDVTDSHKDAMAVIKRSHMNEEYEQLDELSPKTLGSYAKQAGKEASHMAAHGAGAYMMGASKEAKLAADKSEKRMAGVKKATDKLVKKATNEEYDQIEEGTPTKKQVKQAIGIARDKRYAKGNVSGAVKAMDKVNKGLAQHPAVSKELKKQNENFNFKDLRYQLDELSAKKLGQYQKKALDNVSDMRSNEFHPDYGEDRPGEKIDRREKGIKRATDKLVKKAQKTNEEVEQLDELSPKTLGSYAQKSVRDLEKRDRAMGKATQRDRTVVDPEKSKPFQKMAKRRSGLAKAINRLSKEEVEQLDELSPKTLGSYAKKAQRQTMNTNMAIGANSTDNAATRREKAFVKKRKEGASRAIGKLVQKKLSKEDVEQIDELKSKTLKSYISKAGKDLSKRVADYHSKDIASSPSKIIKRDLAIDKAKGRLSMNRQLGRAEESVQINEFEMKTTPKGIKRHYELGKKQAAAGKEMGEVSDNYGPYGIHFEKGYRDHQDAMAKKKKVNEAKMTDAQMDKREKIVMAMKPKMQGFKDRYGDDAKSVMYATATKQAMREEIEEYDYIFESEYLKLSEEEQRLWEKVDINSYDQLLHKKYQKPAKEYGERGKKSKVLDQIRKVRGSINSRIGSSDEYSRKGRKNPYATNFKVSKKDRAEMIYRKKSGRTGQIPSQRSEVRRDKSYDY